MAVSRAFARLRLRPVPRCVPASRSPSIGREGPANGSASVVRIWHKRAKPELPALLS
jgi:hypothetical protein